MKISKTPAGLLMAALLPAGSAIGQAVTVDLYIQPDEDSRLIESVLLDDPRLSQPAPVMDEDKAEAGWHYAGFTDSIEGYVSDAQIGKDLFPVENAIIHAGPAAESVVLGVYQPGEPVEIIETGMWWKIRISLDFPVYFRKDGPAPLPPVTGTPTGAIEEIPAEPALAPEPEPVIGEMTLVDESESAAAAATATGPAPIPERKPVEPEVTGQRYEGTFKRAKRFLGMIKPKAAFYLEGSNGKRIAWVDTDDIVVPGSLKPYLDQAVIIHGEREYLDSKRDWIIRARNMRLK